MLLFNAVCDPKIVYISSNLLQQKIYFYTYARYDKTTNEFCMCASSTQYRWSTLLPA